MGDPQTLKWAKRRVENAAQQTVHPESAEGMDIRNACIVENCLNLIRRTQARVLFLSVGKGHLVGGKIHDIQHPHQASVHQYISRHPHLKMLTIAFGRAVDLDNYPPKGAAKIKSGIRVQQMRPHKYGINTKAQEFAFAKAVVAHLAANDAPYSLQALNHFLSKLKTVEAFQQVQSNMAEVLINSIVQPS